MSREIQKSHLQKQRALLIFKLKGRRDLRTVCGMEGAIFVLAEWVKIFQYFVK
jgi:hypothetical protein